MAIYNREDYRTALPQLEKQLNKRIDDALKTSTGLVGEVKIWAGVNPPSGWLVCDGSEVSKGAYPSLYAVIGDSWGVASDPANFVLPNLKGKVPVGQDANDANFDVVGETGGESTHILTTTEIPAHTHGSKTLTGSWGNNTSRFPDTTNVSGIVTNLSASRGTYFGKTGSSATNTYGFNINATHEHTSVGGSGGHNNLQPYAVVQYIICAM